MLYILYPLNSILAEFYSLLTSNFNQQQVLKQESDHLHHRDNKIPTPCLF